MTGAIVAGQKKGVVLLKRFLLALRFLTVWPWGDCGNVSEEDLAASTVFYPLIGFLVGLLLYAFYFLLRFAWKPLPAAALTVALWEAVSAGLHLDGLMDTFDGLGIRGDREKRLQVMKDSRIGAFGVQAAVIAMLLKTAAVGSGTGLLLVISPLAGRTMMVALMATAGYARSGEGLGRAFTERVGTGQLTIVLIVFILLSYPVLRLPVLAVALVLAAVFFLLRSFFLVNFGGVTGDILGAACEITEITVLFLTPLL